MKISINTKKSLKNKIMGVTPFISLIAFILLMYFLKKSDYSDKAYLSWMAFLLIPVMSIVLGFWKIKITYPVVALIIYLAIGFAFRWWHPGWVIFLTIPIFEILVSKKGDNDEEDEDVIDVDLD